MKCFRAVVRGVKLTAAASPTARGARSGSVLLAVPFVAAFSRVVDPALLAGCPSARLRFSVAIKSVISRPTVDWDTSQADDFRERGVSWTSKGRMSSSRATWSDHQSLAQRRPAVVAGCPGHVRQAACRMGR